MPNSGVWAPQTNSQSSMRGLESTTFGWLSWVVWKNSGSFPLSIGSNNETFIGVYFITHVKKSKHMTRVTRTRFHIQKWDDTYQLASYKVCHKTSWHVLNGKLWTRSMASMEDAKLREDQRMDQRISESDQGKLYACATIWLFFWKDCEDCWKRLAKLKKSIARAHGVNLRVIVIGSFLNAFATFYTCMIGVVPSQDLNVHYFAQEITSMVWVEYVHHSPFDQLCWHHIPAKAINKSKQKNASQFSGPMVMFIHTGSRTPIAESPDWQSMAFRPWRQ